MNKLDSWHLNALLLKELPICWRDNKTVNMSLGSDSVCFQMISTELANKGYETGLQFDSFCSKTLESHHLNMTFTSVIIIKTLSVGPAWVRTHFPDKLNQPIASKPLSFVLPDLRTAVGWTWSWRKPGPATHQSQFRPWKGWEGACDLSVRLTRSSFPDPGKKKATKEHTKAVFDGILTRIFRFLIFLKTFSILIG